MNDLKIFPETIFCAHYDSSTEETPYLNAETSEKELLDGSEPRYVATYKLVAVRRLINEVKEVPA